MVELGAYLESLARERPLFHSEADFQHALAWTIHAAQPGARVRLERPFTVDGDRINLDLLVELEGDRVAIELKYLTRRHAAVCHGERFELQQQSAHPLRRYDCWKDVARLEALLRAGHATVGYFVALSNDPYYWRPSQSQRDSMDLALRLDEGRVVAGQVLDWSPGTNPKTIANREAALPISGSYALRWADYGAPAEGSGSFRYLLLTVTGDGVAAPLVVTPTEPTPAPAPERPPPRERSSVPRAGTALREVRGKYAPLHHHLLGLTTRRWSTTFVELERVLGSKLPPSARNRREWWSNGGHYYANAWLHAGWRVAEVDQSAGQVTFTRQ